VFNKKRNDDRDRNGAVYNEPAPEPNEPIIQAEPEPVAPVVEQDVYSNGNGGAKPAVNNLKPSIISEGFEFIGEIRSNGVVHVEGTVRGKLSLSAITIGSKGSVEGTIQCETLHVKGRFSGTAHCRDLTLSADAVVDGQVYYSQLAVQRGAKITGELIKK